MSTVLHIHVYINIHTTLYFHYNFLLSKIFTNIQSYEINILDKKNYCLHFIYSVLQDCRVGKIKPVFETLG